MAKMATPLWNIHTPSLVNLKGNKVLLTFFLFQTTVRSFLEGQNYEVLSSGIFYIPNCYSSIDNDRDAAAAEAFIKALENCAGVTNVHHNIA